MKKHLLLGNIDLFETFEEEESLLWIFFKFLHHQEQKVVHFFRVQNVD